MMFLMLHVTCSYIFHAHIPILFYHIDIKLFGAFLRLSLSLSVSCPLHSGAYSSSSPIDSTPSHVWFRDDKAYMDFSENFS